MANMAWVMHQWHQEKDRRCLEPVTSVDARKYDVTQPQNQAMSSVRAASGSAQDVNSAEFQ
jgi:hypothetical protein